MSKAKTNALDALRALISERQQYEQWISVLESKREGTPAHVFEKVNADYESRLDRVVGEISGYSDELQLSITTLSSRLIEVAREEDTKRDTLQEAELRAAVGEYEPDRWEEMRVEAQREIDRIGGDRERLDNELAELRSIQTLSAVGSRPPSGESGAAPARADVAGEVADEPEVAASRRPHTQVDANRDGGRDAHGAPSDTKPAGKPEDETPPPDTHRAEQPATQTSPAAAPEPASGASSAANVPAPARSKSARTPPGGTPTGKAARPADMRAEQSKTLKCPECGTPNHPTEWYCERCGGELATM